MLRGQRAGTSCRAVVTFAVETLLLLSLPWRTGESVPHSLHWWVPRGVEIAKDAPPFWGWEIVRREIVRRETVRLPIASKWTWGSRRDVGGSREVNRSGGVRWSGGVLETGVYPGCWRLLCVPRTKSLVSPPWVGLWCEDWMHRMGTSTRLW